MVMTCEALKPFDKSLGEGIVPSEKHFKEARLIDEHVGRKIRMLRESKGLTQPDLANRIDVKFQQLQKYENGSNRVAAGRLYDLAIALNCRVDDFFEGFDGI